MGIWIRSQDKCTLINANNIKIEDFRNNKNAIWAKEINKIVFILILNY